VLHLDFYIFFFILTSTGTGTSRTVLRQKSLSEYPLALCNDGTFASYYSSRGDSQSPHLLINLQGGGACKDSKSCKKRCGTKTPSKNPLCTGNSSPRKILSHTMWLEDPEENPAFHNFQKVFARYCSSDAHSGTRNATDTAGYYFHGKYIIEALLNDIIANKPNIKTMKQVVLMGTSAGAFGVVSNCDLVAEKFREVNKNLDVRCIADGGDFYPRSVRTDGCDPGENTAEVRNFLQAQGDESCFKSSQNSILECSVFSSLYNYITTPLMVVASYVDPVVRGPCTPELNQDQEFWNRWKQEVYAMALKYVEDKPQNAIFLANCPLHVKVKIPFAWAEMDVPLVDGEGTEVYMNVVHNWLTGDGPYQAIDLPSTQNTKCPKGRQSG